MVTVKELEKQIEELTNKWKRALADYQNLEKRIESEKAEFIKFANANLLNQLLTILDYLEKSETQLKDQGLKMAVSQFRKLLKDEGIEEIPIDREKFDPKLMDCVEVIKGKNNEIIEVVQKGYFLNKKILRPAKVKVGKQKIKEEK